MAAYWTSLMPLLNLFEGALDSETTSEACQKVFPLTLMYFIAGGTEHHLSPCCLNGFGNKPFSTGGNQGVETPAPPDTTILFCLLGWDYLSIHSYIYICALSCLKTARAASTEINRSTT